MKTTSTGPFIHSPLKASSFSLVPVFCLLPSMAWGLFRYGLQGGLVLVLTLATAFAATMVIDRIRGRGLRHWSNALMAGIMSAALMPPDIPLYIPVLAVIMGLSISFGMMGTSGSSWLHPVALIVGISHLAWPASMSLAGAGMEPGVPYLSQWFTWLRDNPLPGARPSDLFASFGTAPDWGMGSFLADSFNSLTGLGVPPGLVAAFLGFGGGGLGTSSPVLLLLGSVVLFARKAGDWKLSAAAFLAFALPSLLLGGFLYGTGFGQGDVLFFLADGSFLMVILFLNQFNAALPMTRRGRFVFAALLGLALWVAMYFGRLPLGAVLALLAANVAVPLIDDKRGVPA